MRSEDLEIDRLGIEAALDAAVTDEVLARPMKKIQSELQGLVDDVMTDLKGSVARDLSHYIKEMAGRAVKSLLEGNEQEMIRWLECDRRSYNGRSDGYTTRPDQIMHSVIHGKLFETGSVLLRRQIVDAHSDLITSERIADLEDQLKSVVAHNVKLTAELESTKERLRQHL